MDGVADYVCKAIMRRAALSTFKRIALEGKA